jgi:hypothetical protein
MYDKDERAESFASWMIASGARLDPPDPRHLSHLVALRDAQRDGQPSRSPFARLTSWFGIPALLATSTTATSNPTTCCAPA